MATSWGAPLAWLERAQEAAAELAEIMCLRPDFSANSFGYYRLIGTTCSAALRYHFTAST